MFGGHAMRTRSVARRDSIGPRARPSWSRGSEERTPMAVHMTPEDIAGLLEVEPDVVINAAHEVEVPVYQGEIDRVLLTEALTAAGHHLAPLAGERLIREGEASSG
jgi:hypothetical protein